VKKALLGERIMAPQKKREKKRRLHLLLRKVMGYHFGGKKGGEYNRRLSEKREKEDVHSFKRENEYEKKHLLHINARRKERKRKNSILTESV